MKRNSVKYLIVLSLLVFSVIASSNTTYAATGLADIDGSYAKDAIEELVEKGIINGVGDGKFDPSGKIERQDFAIILAKALSLDTSSAPATSTFSDVPSTHYAFKYVEAAAKAGLIKGNGDGTFGTGAQLSREDMAVLFVRALGVDSAGKGADLNFSDASSIADYAKDSVAAALELGLISGMGDGVFNPKGNAERQAVALVASKFLKVKDEVADKDQQKLEDNEKEEDTSAKDEVEERTEHIPYVPKERPTPEPNEGEPNVPGGPGSPDPNEGEPNVPGGPGSPDPNEGDPNVPGGPGSPDPNEGDPNVPGGPGSPDPNDGFPNVPGGPGSPDPNDGFPNLPGGPGLPDPNLPGLPGGSGYFPAPELPGVDPNLFL